MKQLFKRMLPKRAVQYYHHVLARATAIRAGLPARKLLVIGVTGTKGKSSTVAMLSHCLTALGERVAFSSTVQWGMLGKTWSNRSKMTMPGRGELQYFLQRAVRAGCTAVVLEVSSEGLAQGRHLGIAFDAAVFLNITPEHLESHGDFRKYREAKERLFGSLNRPWRKQLHGKRVPTVIAANVDDPYAFAFLRHAADVHVAFSVLPNDVKSTDVLSIVRASNVQCSADACAFTVEQQQVRIPLLGAFNVSNAMAALTVLRGLGYDLTRACRALSSFPGVPGRMEEVHLPGAPFRTFVDYAHEPASLHAAYAAVRLLNPARVLTLVGAQGGGRDRSKRAIMGALAAEHADVVVVANEDPYDEDPQRIIDDVVGGAQRVAPGRVRGITDRRQALRWILQHAQPNDVLLITGKGGEEVMAVAGGTLIPWDDRQVVQEEWREHVQPRVA